MKLILSEPSVVVQCPEVYDIDKIPWGEYQFPKIDLTDDGRFKESDESIYTKNAFECQGLDVEIDFDKNISYQIYCRFSNRISCRFLFNKE